MAKIKGLGIQARVEYLRERFGEDGLGRILAALEPGNRVLLEQPINISGWYPLALSDDLLGCAEQVCGSGDGAICRDIGSRSCRKGLETVYKIFTHVDSVAQGIAKIAPLLWKSYYDAGELRVKVHADNHIEYETVGVRAEKPWRCQILNGYMETQVEMLGGSDVHVDHGQCQATGAPVCRWIVTWRQ